VLPSTSTAGATAPSVASKKKRTGWHFVMDWLGVNLVVYLKFYILLKAHAAEFDHF